MLTEPSATEIEVSQRCALRQHSCKTLCRIIADAIAGQPVFTHFCFCSELQDTQVDVLHQDVSDYHSVNLVLRVTF
jgi:hypothetical protein